MIQLGVDFPTFAVEGFGEGCTGGNEQMASEGKRSEHRQVCERRDGAWEEEVSENGREHTMFEFRSHDQTRRTRRGMAERCEKAV